MDKLRYIKWFVEKVTKSTSHTELHSLLPTAAAAKYHSLSIFYQIIDWKTNVITKSISIGLAIAGRQMPNKTDQQAVPSELLDVICCGCEKDCKSGVLYRCS